MNTSVIKARVLYPFVLLLVVLAVVGCTNQPGEPTPSPVSLVLPTVYPSETPLPTPTRTPVPTLSPTPLPKAVLQEPCISYYDQTNGDLKFTCYRNRNWKIETVDSTGDVGLYSSLAFDHFSNPYVSYYSRSDRALKLAKYNGTQWTTEFVTKDGDAGFFTALAVGWDGTIYISYYDLEDGLIRMARKIKDQWILEDIDEIGQSNNDDYLTMYRTCLALEPSGNPVVSYVDFETQNLKLARSDPEGNWKSEVVDGNSKVGWSHSLAINPNGMIAISYYDVSLQVLKLATLENEQWTYTTLDNSGDVGIYSSVAVSEQGKIAVAYFDDDSDDVRFLEGGGIIYIRTRSLIGWHLSMALDETGTPWIFFYELSQRDLGYAKFENGRFRINYIAKSGDVGLYPSLKFVPKYDTN